MSERLGSLILIPLMAVCIISGEIYNLGMVRGPESRKGSEGVWMAPGEVMSHRAQIDLDCLFCTASGCKPHEPAIQVTLDTVLQPLPLLF